MGYGLERAPRGRRRRLAAIGLGCSVLMAGGGSTSVASSAESNPIRADVAADQVPDLSGSLATRKGSSPATEGLSARLAALSSRDLRSESNREQAEELSLRWAGSGSLVRDGERIVASARLASASDRVLAELRAAGAEVLAVHPEYLTVDLAIAPADLRAVAAVAGVESVSEALEPMVAGAGASAALRSGAPQTRLNTCVGSVVTEADSQMRTAEARVGFGIDGIGTKVGVVSDSYDTGGATVATHAAQDIASGDLPGPGNPCNRGNPVQVLADQPDRTDEGRGMLQLVHDLAPGAALAFATSFPTAEAMADNIRALRTAGSTVIVDDVSYLDEPMYQDGPISNAVNEVTAAGIPYYSSAANSNVISQFPGGVSGQTGRNIASYEATFRGLGGCTGGPGTCMDFNPGAGADATNTILLSGGSSFRLDFQWAQPRGGVTADLDVYAVDQATGTVLAQGVDDNSTTQKPLEIINVQNPTGSARFIDIYVNKFSGAANPRIKWIMLGGGGVLGAEYDVNQGGDVVGPTIFGHNGAANAVSTAAVPYNNAGTLETFSSRGPVTLYFGPVGATPAAPLPAPQVLAKPDLAATDGGRTTFFTPQGAEFRFSGTSAAAPDAAAVAALQQDAVNGAIGGTAVVAAQKTTASPVGFFGPDAAGAGLVNAVGAVGANPPTAPQTVITKKPKNKLTKKSAKYKFTSNAPEASFKCKIDRSKYRRCTSPLKVKRIPYGRHLFKVRAKANGLVDGSPAKDKFKRKRKRGIGR